MSKPQNPMKFQIGQIAKLKVWDSSMTKSAIKLVGTRVEILDVDERGRYQIKSSESTTSSSKGGDIHTVSARQLEAVDNGQDAPTHALSDEKDRRKNLHRG